MADVGRSTAAHAEGDIDTHALVARLENWGAWQRSLPDAGPGEYPRQPMFRDVVDRYRVEYAPTPFDAQDAQIVEELISRTLGVRLQLCLEVRFVLQFSSRRAAGIISREGFPCTHTTYLRWIEDSIEVVAMAC